jgi:hypothetical protein
MKGYPARYILFVHLVPRFGKRVLDDRMVVARQLFWSELEAHEDKLRKKQKNPETRKPGKWSF